MGCGRVFNQGAALVSQAIASGAMFEGRAWKEITENALRGSGNTGAARGSVETVYAGGHKNPAGESGTA
jgi:hypothetical protein